MSHSALDSYLQQLRHLTGLEVTVFQSLRSRGIPSFVYFFIVNLRLWKQKLTRFLALLKEK